MIFFPMAFIAILILACSSFVGLLYYGALVAVAERPFDYLENQDFVNAVDVLVHNG